MQPTKILWLIKGLGVGGAERLLAQALPYLDRRMFDYEIAYVRPGKNSLVVEFEQAGIPVFCLGGRHAYNIGVVSRLLRLLKERRVTLIHSHLPYAGIVGRLAGKLAPVKAVLYTEHNLWQRYHWLTSTANRLTYSWNDAVIAVSGEVERCIRSNKFNGRLKLSTILNGVDSQQLAGVPRDAQGVREEFCIPLDHRLVVHVANFTPKKRHVDLLRAAQLILKQDPSITFLLVGQGPLERKVKDKAKQFGIDGRLVFTGFRSDAPRLMAAADLFVLPSLYEGLPVSLLEAMAVGKPVIATRVGGIPEVVTDGVEGFLVEPLSPHELAEKVVALLHDPKLQQVFSENGIKRVREQFDVRRMVERTEDLYKKVLAEKQVF